MLKRGKLRECRANLCARLFRREKLVRKRGRVGCFQCRIGYCGRTVLLECVAEFAYRNGTALPYDIYIGTLRYLVQPWPERTRCVKAMQCLPRAYERFLRGILCVFLAGAKPSQEAIHARQEGNDERIESVIIFLRALYQFLLIHGGSIPHRYFIRIWYAMSMNRTHRTLMRTSLAACIVLVGLSMAPHAFASDRIHLSNNWSGYEMADGTYTAISGTWVVPDSSAASSHLSADAAWIGIGGATTEDLIQAGTQAIFHGDDVSYHAWYETLPDSERELPVPIKSGDTVSVFLQEITPNVWHLTFMNRTTGVVYNTDIPYVSNHSSAEWIVERPLAVTDDGTGYLTLSDFGTVAFSGGAAVEDGRMVSLSDTTAEQILMNGSHATFAAAPSVAQNGAFEVSRLSSSESRTLSRALERRYNREPLDTQKTAAPTQSIEPVSGTFIIHIVF